MAAIIADAAMNLLLLNVNLKKCLAAYRPIAKYTKLITISLIAKLLKASGCSGKSIKPINTATGFAWRSPINLIRTAEIAKDANSA